MDRNHRLRALGDGVWNQGHVHRVSIWLHIHEDGACTCMSDRFRGGHEGIGWRDHLVPRPDPYSLERQNQSVSAIGHPDYLACAQEPTEGLLEFLDRRPEDEGRVAKN